MPSVAEVLDLPAFQSGSPEVLSAQQALGSEVRWVHVSELTDIGALLDGGELILATGVGLPETASGLRAYVDDLADAGISGLVLELGRRYQTVPPELISRAEERDLPLIQLRNEIRFVDVTLAVHSLIIESQTQRLQHAAMVHEVFTSLGVEGASPQEIVDEARRITGHSIVLENLARQVLLHSARGKADALLTDWEARSRRNDIDPLWLQCPVQARGNRWGRLILVPDDGVEVEGSALTVLERCAQTLALNRLVEREDHSLAHQAQSAILADIVGGRFSSSAEVYSRARALGTDLADHDYFGLVVRIGGRPRATGVLERERNSRADAEVVGAALASVQAQSLVGTIEKDQVKVLAVLDAGDDPDLVAEEIARSIHRAFAVASAARSTIGVGSVVERLRDVRGSFVEADQASAAAAGSDRLFNRLSDVRIRGLTQLLRQDPRLQTFVERELGDLMRHDDRHGTDLLQVLEVFLAAGGNKSIAARQLNMSRPALYHRMTRIESLTGLDLSTAESRTSLHLALMSLEAMRGQNLSAGDGFIARHASDR